MATVLNAGAGSGQIITSTGSNWATKCFSVSATTTARSQLKLEGEEADLLINDKSLSEWMSKIEQRLLILQPKPELLEEYEALKLAYEHYKTLEALLIKKAEIIDK